MRIVPVILVASALAVAGSASAQTIGFNGADEIARGDYVQAERVIDQSRKLFPTYPEMMLNLAVVYRHTGRTDQARALYEQVLQRPDEDLDLQKSGDQASSHALAREGLARLAVRVAAR